MALARFGRQAKKPYGLCVKMTAVAVLGLCFIFIWSMFSSSSTSVTTRRESFDDINEPSADAGFVSKSGTRLEKMDSLKKEGSKEDDKVKSESNLESKDQKVVDSEKSLSNDVHGSRERNEKQVVNKRKEKADSKSPEGKRKGGKAVDVSEDGELENEKDDENGEEEQELVVDGKEDQGVNQEGESSEETEASADDVESTDQEAIEKVEEDNSMGKKRKIKGPVFDPKAHYSWKLCSTRSKHNYLPCIDNKGGLGRLQSYRHTERSCPRVPPVCLVPLPHGGYETPVRWPESKLKVRTMI